MNAVSFRSRLVSALVFCASLQTVQLATAQSPESPAPPPAAEHAQNLRRFALVVGVNDGGPKRIPLRYAGRDASSFHRVMTELGGIDPTDALLLDTADANSVRQSIEQIQGQVRAARASGQHTEFLFFYSGHSDEQGLRMGKSLLPYRELRQLVKTVGADVQVAVLDSCASGTLTRLKGGSRKAPFLLDLSSKVSGHAFLTSASGNEAAQESDRIQASFFTHYLVTGLRGAADFNSNGRVTLNEAYRFAFDETLARTQKTQAGVQHPAYDIQLVGTGDLVMTDLKATSAGLRLPKTLAGRFFLRNATGALVAELYKPGGRSVELALAPGQYSVAVTTDAQQLAGSVVLTEHNTVALSGDALRAVDKEPTRTRGSSAVAKANLASTRGYRVVPVAASIVSPFDTNQGARYDGSKILNHAQFNLFWGRTDKLLGIQWGIGHHVDDALLGAQIAVAVNSVSGPAVGAQISAGVNLAFGPGLHGQGGGLLGVQIASGANLLRGKLLGAQFAGGFNGVDGDLYGAQFAGGMSLVSGAMVGLQASGGLNFAAQMLGLQLAPLNVAVRGHGAQIGVVNVMSSGRSHVQLGVFNYADEADVQIGVLSVTRKGGVHPQLWTSTAGVAMFSLRLDANYTYSLLHVGANFGTDSNWSAGLGLGAKLPLFEDRLYLEVDASAYYLKYEGVAVEDTPQLGQARLLARFQAYKHLSVFVGPTFNVLWAHNAAGGQVKRPGYGGPVHAFGSEDHRVRLWQGFAAGLSF